MAAPGGQGVPYGGPIMRPYSHQPPIVPGPPLTPQMAAVSQTQPVSNRVGPPSVSAPYNNIPPGSVLSQGDGFMVPPSSKPPYSVGAPPPMVSQPGPPLPPQSTKVPPQPPAGQSVSTAMPVPNNYVAMQGPYKFEGSAVQNGPHLSNNTVNTPLRPSLNGPMTSYTNGPSTAPPAVLQNQKPPVSMPCAPFTPRSTQSQAVPSPNVTPVSTSISNSNMPLQPPPTSGAVLSRGWSGTSSPLVTPTASEPASARSSRNPSPIPTQRYDSMEGQFPSSKPSPVSSVSNNNHQTYSSNAMVPPLPMGTKPPAFSPNTSQSLPPPPSMGMYGPRPAVSSSASVPPPPMPPSSMPASSSGPPLMPPMSAYPGYNATSPPRFTQTVPPSVPSSAGPPPASSTTSVTRPRYPQQVGYSQQPSSKPSQQNYTQQAPTMPPLPNNINSAQNQRYPEPPVGGLNNYDPQLHARMSGLSVNSSFSKMWGHDSFNLLQDRNILPRVPEDPPKPVLPLDKSNCNPDIFRSTLTKIPESQSLLQKSRLPFGVLIHPFRDVNHLPVIQNSTIVRCRSCRTYINPFVQFVERQRWTCNICFRINEVPEEFLHDPVSKKYGEPERRPEIRHATVEFIAPSEYMLRPPQPAVYLFVLDVSHTAIQTGYISSFCKVLLEELDNLPGDGRTQIGFVTFNSSIHFYNLGEGLNQPQMLVVSDIDDVFLPSPDSLLVNIHESKALVQDLLMNLPKMYADTGEPSSALGAAVQTAFKLLSPVGGRVSVFQTCLPNIGPGSLKPREDPNQRAGKEIPNLNPAVDFYKKLALECSGQQIAVDLFLLSTQYADLASLACISKFSAGCVSYYPGMHSTLNKAQVEKFEVELQNYLTRKVGFEAVMRIRCTRGLAIHTFHGNFFVRSTDLLSLPNINPDTGYAMQIQIEESLTECNVACFQAAVLYTSSKGERRIRVHTLSLPVTSLLQDVLGSADQDAIIGLLSKMAVDRSLSSSVIDARDALINACIDLIGVFKVTLPSGQAAAGLPIPYSARLLPLYVLALLKHAAFRIGVSTKLDERVYAMEQMKTMPLSYLMTYIYPRLYPLHTLNDENGLSLEDGTIVPQPPILQLTFEKIDRHGCYLLDTMENMFVYVGKAINDQFCANVLGVPHFSAIPDHMTDLPELSTPESERVRIFISWLLSRRPYHSPLRIIKEDSKDRNLFTHHLVDDRTESALSYYEFLQHLKQQVQK